MHDALVRMGIPGPLATLVSMALDPRYAKEELMEAVEIVGKELGVPDSVLNKLKTIINKADEYAKTFATQGFGGVVKELGKDSACLRRSTPPSPSRWTSAPATMPALP